MSYTLFDRERIIQGNLGERKNKVKIEQAYIRADAPDPDIPATVRKQIARTAEYILDARAKNRSVMLSFGAHSIKNGLGPLMVKMLERGWITHLATNGAGIIHDWEFAFLGESSESVAENLPAGHFGIWDETGKYLNLAINAGAHDGLGYGASVGRAICDGGINIPPEDELLREIKGGDGAAADLLSTIRKGGIAPGWLPIPAPYGRFSLQAGAWRLGIPSTDHPMFGHDIIYTHPLNCGQAIGRAAGRDFRTFARSMENLSGGVYLSLGSAIMSPMVFSKASAMLQKPVKGHHITVVDLAKPAWSRLFEESAPSSLDFLTLDNRDFLLCLYHQLDEND